MKKILPGAILFAVAFLAIAALAVAVQSAYAQGSGPDTYVGPDTCAKCHPAQAEAWAHSTHANASQDPNFVEAWKAVKSPGYCLDCHTTGYDTNTGKYAFEGVTCEGCHGPYVNGHPQQAMEVNSSPEACGRCHQSTLNEWQLSRHGSARIGCTSCHNSHDMSLKEGDPDSLCKKCHADVAAQGSHAAPNGQPLACADCHIGPRSGDPAEGHANTGHTFSVGTGTCSRCHADKIHVGVAAMMGNATPVPPTVEPSPTTSAPEVATPADPMTGVALPTLISGAAGLGLGALWSRVRARKS